VRGQRVWVVHHLGSVPGMIEWLFQYALPLVAFGVCWWPCCGTPPDCTVFSDDFNRSDSTSLGSDWTETTGDSTITSNTLRFTTTSAKATCNTNSPVAARRIRVKTSGSNANNLARIYIGAWTVEIKFSTSTGYIRILSHLGGIVADSGNLNVALSTMHPVTICYDGLSISAQLDSISASQVRRATSNISSLVNALGTGGTLSGSVSFDDWVLENLNDDCECGISFTTASCTSCATGTTPDAVLLTFTGITGLSGVTNCCNQINGAYLIYPTVPGNGCNGGMAPLDPYWTCKGLSNCNCVTAGGGDYCQLSWGILTSFGNTRFVVNSNTAFGTSTDDCDPVAAQWVNTFTGEGIVDCKSKTVASMPMIRNDYPKCEWGSANLTWESQ
jgi:hypothetical protein